MKEIISKGTVIKRLVPLMAALLSVLSIALLCFAVEYHRSVRRVRHTREAALSEDLLIMRECIDNFTKDKEEAPQSLQDLVEGKYLTEIPRDPLTGKKDWIPHFGTVVLDKGRTTFGIDNVHSSSEHNGW